MSSTPRPVSRFPRLRPALRTGVRVAVRGVAVLAGLVAIVVVVVAFVARGKPDLGPWHRIELAGEPVAEDLRRLDWAGYVAGEEALFAERDAALAANAVAGRYRFETGSVLRRPTGTRDWNRSFELAPASEPVGGVLLLHGLSDSPYNMRHFAEHYRSRGFVVMAPRMPGHGTVPAGLLHAQWQDWLAVVELAMRELRARVGDDRPLHVVGYSNGGALALKYALDRADHDDDGLPRADRLVLVSPMIGVSSAARFTKFLPLLGGFDYFEQSRWLDILPEYNPVKYNSFPVNAARQSWALTTTLQAQLLEARASGDAKRLPPVLTFQSVLDDTVSTPAVLHALYEQLPANGSELVVFDINRGNLLEPLFDHDASAMLDALQPGPAATYTLTTIANVAVPAVRLQVEERKRALDGGTVTRPLPYEWPADVYSLSHVALPFPVDDPLYGLQPRTDEDFGIRLGTLTLHGERGALSVGAEQLMRISSNPFFPYLLDRIDQAIAIDSGNTP